jgi:hypothetical protein
MHGLWAYINCPSLRTRDLIISPPLPLPSNIHTMQFTTAFVLAALPFLVSGAPVDAPAEARKLTIGLTKRSRLTHESGTVDMAAVKTHVSRTSAKIQRGFAAFQRNTGVPHPLAAPVIGSSKRATGSDQLTDDHEELWYGTISVGTPAVAFTGKPRVNRATPRRTQLTFLISGLRHGLQRLVSSQLIVRIDLLGAHQV